MIETVEARAYGFRASIVGRSVRTPEDMERELAWPGAHPMHFGLDQLGPTRALGRPDPGARSAHEGDTRPRRLRGRNGTSRGHRWRPGRDAARALLRASRR